MVGMFKPSIVFESNTDNIVRRDVLEGRCNTSDSTNQTAYAIHVCHGQGRNTAFGLTSYW